MKMDIIDIDWDFMMKNHKKFSPKLRALLVKLMRPSFQQAIFDLRKNWDIPPHKGLNIITCDKWDYWSSPEKEVKGNKVTLLAEAGQLMKLYGMPLEYNEYVMSFVVFGGIIEYTAKSKKIRREQSSRAMEDMKLKEKYRKKYDAYAGIKDEYLSKETATCGGTDVLFDEKMGKLIITHDVYSNFEEIAELKTFIESCKKKATDYYYKHNNLKHSGAKRSYTFLVELIINTILDEYPNASNIKILAEAQLKFKEIHPDIPLRKVKELPALADAPGFVKCVQRVKAARES